MKLSRTQETLLELMKRLDEFLRENNIRYYLFGGSLLGAMRHDGFIPWDDDIDIVMDRDDYYRLGSIADKLPWDDVSYDCYENNPEFMRPFGIFTSLRDTRFVKSRAFMGGVGMGTGIDVFPMDNVPRQCLDEYLKNSLLFQEIQTDALLNNPGILRYRDEYYECKRREKLTGKEAETERLRTELEKYPRRDDDLKVVRLWSKRPRVYEPGMMEDPVYHRFEDTEFPVPARAEECLIVQYGEDWNVVPSDAERDTHAFYTDHELSSVNYYREISRNVDWDHIKEVLDRRKQNEIRLLDRKIKIDEFRHLISKR